MSTDNPRMRLGIVLVGLAQGLLLWLAHEAIAHNIWPATVTTARFVWFTLAIAMPPALQLLISGADGRRLTGFGLGLGAVLALLAVYAGLSMPVTLAGDASGVVVPYALTLAAGWYVFLPFAQTWYASGRRVFPYTSLFEHAWNNFLVLGIAAAFTGIFHGLLALWGGLFKVLDIDFFAQLFSNRAFIYPVTGVVFGFAVWLARQRTSAVVATRRIILAVFSGLLPLLALIAVLFLAALPFTGLQPLWNTRHATPLMLSLQLLTILFLNAVYQDGSGEAPYRPWLRRAIQVAVVLLPVYTLLSGYALGLRIGQHGWSVDRVWAAILVVVAGLYAGGYAFAALRRHGAWMARMAPVNVGMAVLLMLLAVTANSPALDARRIAVHSQLGRLLAGKTDAEKFDYDYFRFELGRAGERALEQLRDIRDHAQAETIRKQAAAALAKTNRYSYTPEAMSSVEQLAAHLVLYPSGRKFDRDFLQRLYNWRTNEYPLTSCFVKGQTCPVLAIDLDGDRRDEYVLFHGMGGSVYTMTVYARIDGGWKRVGSLRVPYSEREPAAQVEGALGRGEFKVLEPQWRDLRVGSRRYRFQEAD